MFTQECHRNADFFGEDKDSLQLMFHISQVKQHKLSVFLLNEYLMNSNERDL